VWGRTVGYLSDNLASCVSYLIIFVPRKFDRYLFALKTISPYKLWLNERCVKCDRQNMQISQRLRFCWWNVFNGKCTFLRGSFLYVSKSIYFSQKSAQKDDYSGLFPVTCTFELLNYLLPLLLLYRSYLQQCELEVSTILRFRKI